MKERNKQQGSKEVYKPMAFGRMGGARSAKKKTDEHANKWSRGSA
jgi:hypothetical protein